MILNINIPTKGRPKKLLDCLQSINYSGQYKVYIHCYDKADDLPDEIPVDCYEIIENKQILTIESHNIVCREKGHFMGLSDDIVFHPNALDSAVNALELHHKSDAIIDFTVANMNAPDGCYMLLGDSFINKFPERTPYCPEYRFMFASAELRDFAIKEGVFFKCDLARLDHYHPAVTGKPDETHTRIRSKGIISDDQQTYFRRQKSGKLWSHYPAG